MRFELIDRHAGHTTVSSSATVCRLPAEGAHWRVLVETWGSGSVHWGRFVFEPEAAALHFDTRPGPAMLRGRTRDEVLAAAHEVPERRLRELLRSLL